MPNHELISSIEKRLRPQTLLSKQTLEELYVAMSEPNAIIIRGLSISEMMNRSINHFLHDPSYAEKYPKINHSLLLLKASNYI